MKFQLQTFAIIFLSLALGGTVRAQEDADPLDAMLAQLISGAGNSQAFYDALLKTPLVVVAEPDSPAAASKGLVFAHRIQDGKKIIDVYTSARQLESAPEAKIGRTIQMPAREMLGLIAQTGCDVGLNSYSGHGGRLTAQKISELLKA